MKITFVITIYQAPELLRLCLKSLKENIGDFEYNVAVADGEPKENLKQELEALYPGIVYLATEKNVGYPSLVNLGLKNIDWGDYIMVMNGDMIIPAGQMEKMIEYLEQNRDIGVLGPQLLYFSNKPQNSCFRFYHPLTVVFRRTFLGKTSWGKKDLARFQMRDYDRAHSRDVDWIMGSAMFLRRNALEAVGLMDERFFMYFEDVDWCRRFWEKGFRVVFYPNAKLFHYHGKLSKKKGLIDLLFNKYVWIHIISGLRYFLKWGWRTPHYYQDDYQAK